MNTSQKPADTKVLKPSQPSFHQHLQGLAAYLATQIKGQPHVIERVVSVLHRGELGLAHHSRPKGSFLFVGPTGTGKTEITNAFTAYLFGGAKPLRFDMSEYQNQSSVEKLIGGKPDEIGLLGRAIAGAQHASPLSATLKFSPPQRSASPANTPQSSTKQPGAAQCAKPPTCAQHPSPAPSNTLLTETLPTGTLLFDEIEKAHPLVLDLFLQMLDDASITLATGERRNLSHFYIVFTSNIGAAEAMRMQSAPFASIERTVLARVSQHLRPELVGRMTERVVFNRLPFETQRAICESMIAAELRRLRSLGHELEITDADVETILRDGYHKTLGARPMRSTVERFLQERLAAQLLAFAGGVMKPRY